MTYDLSPYYRLWTATKICNIYIVNSNKFKISIRISDLNWFHDFSWKLTYIREYIIYKRKVIYIKIVQSLYSLLWQFNYINEYSFSVIIIFSNSCNTIIASLNAILV